MSNDGLRVCPVELAGHLDSKLRRWFQNPQKILGPYVKPGMTVLDVGCGPGFFSIDMAQMVGESGHVIASDLQDGMLRKVGDKIKGTPLEERMTLHKCEEHRLGISQKVDFVLLFYMVHEVPDQKGLFTELHDTLNPNGRVLIVEPPVHVSRSAFEKTVDTAKQAGFKDVERPKIRLSKSVILEKQGD